MIKLLSDWKYQKILFLAVGALLLCIVGYRAAILSFTYDESGTYLFYRTNTVWELFFEEKVWTSANNHVLNTLLYKVSIGLFGHSDFTLRLPNVVAFVAMYLVCVFYLFPNFKTFWARASVIIILFLNPYTLEFYSLCRGYGLSMLFHFSALCCFWHYLQFKKSRTIYWAFFWLSLASLSLLTNLLLLPVCGLAFWIIIFKDKTYFQTADRKHLIAAPIIFSILSLGLLIKPIYFLSKHNEFDFGVSSLWLSFESLVSKSLRNHAYIGKNTLVVFTVALIIFILFLLYKSYKSKQMAFFGLSFFILITSLFATYLILDIQFPSERKTTIFVPFLAILVGGLINGSKLNQLKQSILIGTSVLLSIHFIKATQLDSTIEWYYDKNTKKYAELIKEKSKGEKYIVQADWLYQSTMNYYIETMDLKNVILLSVTKDFKVKGIPDAIICTKKQIKPFPGYVSPFPDEYTSIFLKQ